MNTSLLPLLNHSAITSTAIFKAKKKLTMGSLLSKTASKLSQPEKSSPNTTNMSPATFTHFAGAQTNFKPPLIANENAYLGDIASSQPLDPTSPISAGFYRLEKGTPLVYEYTYHEMKIIVDGEFDISDETGKKVHAVKGDVFYCK
jgi:ethanolamine utilization protein EutQ (cupin superfamily)